MRILQFTCKQPQAAQMRAATVHVINGLANLLKSAADPTRGGSELPADKLAAMHTDPDTYWLDYDALLRNLPHEGAVVAAALFEGIHPDTAPEPSATASWSAWLLKWHDGSDNSDHVATFHVIDVPAEELGAQGYLAPNASYEV